MSIWGIVIAAGAGSRFGGPKHAGELGGKPLWEWARGALLEGGADGVVVVGPVPGGLPGGDRRQDSVSNGLAAVPHDTELIAVHDAARPLAPATLVADMVAVLKQTDATAVVPTLPLRDTVKEISASATVIRTLDRTQLVAVQTPQLFRAEVLRAAHAQFRGEATDDAAMVEAMGGSVMTVPGRRAAFKITYPEDMVLAEYFLKSGDRQ